MKVAQATWPSKRLLNDIIYADSCLLSMQTVTRACETTDSSVMPSNGVRFSRGKRDKHLNFLYSPNHHSELERMRASSCSWTYAARLHGHPTVGLVTAAVARTDHRKRCNSVGLQHSTMIKKSLLLVACNSVRCIVAVDPRMTKNPPSRAFRDQNQHVTTNNARNSTCRIMLLKQGGNFEKRRHCEWHSP